MPRTDAHMFPVVIASLVLLILSIQVNVDALTLTYCSSQNTGSDSSAKYWTWQSNGWCQDQCQDSYAYAIVQTNDCWCSNLTPQDQEDISSCDEKCPGYPDEYCGSSDGKLYGYVKLSISPSGTQQLSGSTSAKVSSTTASSNPSTSKSSIPTTPTSASPSQNPVSSSLETPHDTETVVQTTSESTVVVTQTASQQASSTAPPTTLATSTSSTTSSSSAAVQQPSTDVQTLIISGNPVTKTIVYTPSSAPDLTQSQKKSSNTGAIVGGVVGGIGGIAALVGGVLFFLWRRRRQQREGEDDGATQSGVRRNTSTMSKSGLLGMSEKTPQYPPQIATNVQRNSRIMDNESISPISGSDRRHSRPYIFDQRLNPSAIMNLDNTSRGSFVSMDDARDYGRTLNVRNPDPDPQ